MAPQTTFKEISLKNGERLSQPPPGEEVVISGISGCYPQCSDIHELRDKLLSKTDMITDRPSGQLHTPGLPIREGAMKDKDRFDNAFFRIPDKEANIMDPVARMMLEKTYEAVVDAGVNPSELRGKTIGVFASSCSNDSERATYTESKEGNPHAITATERVSLCNRISKWLKVNGPSTIVETACSSAASAINAAYEAIRDGTCESAIVAGGNTVLSDFVTMCFRYLGIVNKEAVCRVFDEEGNGYVRSEAVCVIFLQKYKDAKRVYSTIVHSKTNSDGYKPRGIAFPSADIQCQLLEDFYEECHVNPSDVDFIEAHGTGTQVGDPEELSSLSKVFLPGRERILPIGSIKSNLGHSEGAAFVVSVSKAVLCMENGQLYPNLHFNTPIQNSEALRKGIFKVVTDVEPFEGTLIGINSFGFGGSNGHVLLKRNPKTMKDGGYPSDKIPRLVNVSGRTKEATRSLIEQIQSSPVNAEFINLLHCVHSRNVEGHRYRGHTILTPGEKSSSISISFEKRPPLWFMFSGLGSQWPGMAESLLPIPAFAEAVKKCDRVLASLGLDIKKIITEKDSEIFYSPVNCLVGIATVQIGLVEILRAVGIVPDGVTGHSIGDLICAYVDGSLSLEQTILVAYYRGLVCMEHSVPEKSLLLCEKEALENMKTEKVEVVGSFSRNDCIIAGDPQDIEKCSKILQDAGQNVKTLNCGGIALHSASLANTRPLLAKHLHKVIPDAKPRSDLWLSSSRCAQQLSSAEYHTDQFLEKAMFFSTSEFIPGHSLLLDVSPNPINSYANLSLYNEQGVLGLLSTLGKLYERGIDMNLSKLYPPVEYPVSRGTPMISPLVKWNHTQQWFVVDDSKLAKVHGAEKHASIFTNFPIYAFLEGHNIDGRNLYPATGYLFLVWEALAQICNASTNILSVHFKGVRFHRATHIAKNGKLMFTISIQKNTGEFEVMDGSSLVVTGHVLRGSKSLMPEVKPLPDEKSEDSIDFTKRDIYKELMLRGYNYKGIFKSLLSVNQELTKGQIQWNLNWIAFMDNILQVHILAHDTRNLYVPTYIHEMSINAGEHRECLENAIDDSIIPININKELGVCKAGGVEIRGIRATAIARRKPLSEPVLERHQFAPYCVRDQNEYTMLEVLTICVHVLLENNTVMKLNTAELFDDNSTSELQPVSPVLLDIIGNLPLMQANATIYTDEESSRFTSLHPDLKVKSRNAFKTEKNHIIVVNDGMNNRDLLKSAISSLSVGGCIIIRQQTKVIPSEDTQELETIVDYVVGNERILMMKRKTEENPSSDVTVVHVTGSNYEWLPVLQAAVKGASPDKRVYMVAQQEPLNGILGLFNCLCKEFGSVVLRCVFILDDGAPPFDPALHFYHEQLKKDMAVNILNHGQWGSYRHFLLENTSSIDSQHAYSNVATYGNLSSITWFQGRENTTPLDTFESRGIVHVYYSSINFKDIMLATGKLTADLFCRNRTEQDCVLGFEYSGRTANGERVMGIIERRGVSNLVESDPFLTWRVPNHWSLEEAATVPIVYLTVMVAFVHYGRVKKGESILIHAGSGGIGIAAINLAQHYGLSVFTTVGTQEKRTFLQENFPQIPSQNIGNSRDTSFEEMIMRETNGRGVDLVLNSLAGEKLVASLRCLAPGGRFLEIGKFDLQNNKHVGMELFSNNKSYYGVMADLLLSGGDDVKIKLHSEFKDILESGAMKPLIARTTYSENEVEQAYRYMAAGKHVGKVLIKIRDEEEDRKAIPSVKLMKAQPRFYSDPKLSYIIAGGLGGFGLELADWIVCRGARFLVLTSRRGMTKGYQSYRVRIWRSYGVKVLISTSDISTHDGVKQLITDANKLAPVGGIFNLAAVLHDALFENQTIEKFMESAKPKSVATHHFDVVSRQMCPQLQYFVVFSSVSCGRGNAGQTNYGMSNSVMERICEARVQDGLPGLAIQWGAIGEVGLVADMMEDSREMVIGGTLQQTVSSCLKALDSFLQQSRPVVGSMVVAEKASLTSSQNLSERILGILGLHDNSKIRPNTCLSELGMDSMTGVEIKQVLEQEFELFLTPNDIRELTLARLEELGNSKGDGGQEEQCTENDFNAVMDLRIYNRVALKGGQTEYPSIVHLPSLETSASTVFLVPGVEGLAEDLAPLASKLSSRVLSLQMFSNQCGSTVQEMADFFIKELVKAGNTLESPVLLIGFSFGGLVALEAAAVLERKGYQCRLVLIDSSPEYLAAPLQKLLTNGEDNFLLTSLIYYMETNGLLGANEKQEVLEELQSLSWKKQLDWLNKRMKEQSVEHSDHIVKVFDEAIQRVLSIVKYNEECEYKIQSPVMLLRSTKFLNAFDDRKDCGLSKYCERVEEVHLIKGYHTQITEHPDSARYINEFLNI